MMTIALKMFGTGVVLVAIAIVIGLPTVDNDRAQIVAGSILILGGFLIFLGALSAIWGA